MRRRSRHFFVVISATLLAATVAQSSLGEDRLPADVKVEALAADMDKNISVWQAFQRKEYAALLETLPELAKQGSPVAQYVLGELLLVGSELDGDRGVAIEWFERAAIAESPLALSRLASIYFSNRPGERDVPRGRDMRVRWGEINVAYASYFAKKTKPIFFIHRPGEGPAHKFWNERAAYFSAYLDALKQDAPLSDEELAAEQAPHSSKLPMACQPSTPPTSAMMVAKLDQVDGVLSLYVDKTGRVLGILVKTISDGRVRFGALEAFQKSLRSSSCSLEVLAPMRLRQFEVPFSFRLY